MCGIAGILHTDGTPVSHDVIAAMTESLAHRGPDGDGVALFDAVAIGHRRLSIIDLEGGKQPLSNEDGTVWITFNGEIYNFLELRDTLERAGHAFRTHSDTEVIVHAYEEWGTRCVERFRGMFAFAIIDLNARQIFLARDHLGIKPLYYLQLPHCLAFASELQALRHVSAQLDLDLEAVDQYLWLQYIPAPRSIYRQIRKLPPAHHLTVTFDGRISEPTEYWQVHFQPVLGRSEGEWLEAMDAVLRDSVRAHLVSDVPFGAFLSGGVDSSTIVAYMAELLDHPVRTFSIGFEEDDFNELPYAEDVAHRCATEHHVEIVKPDALEVLPKLVHHYGEPFGDSSAIPTYYLCRMARKSLPMVLSGDGGDEMFAGYGTYRSWMGAHRQEMKPLWKRMLLPLARTFFPRRYPRRPAPNLAGWLGLISYIDTPQRRQLWRPEYQQTCPAPLEIFEREYARAKGYGLCEQVQSLDMRTYLPYDILTKVDIASMMHGLEVRTPLVDVRVAEFAATIPSALNLNWNRERGWEGKLLLKKTMHRMFSPEFLSRKKMGFGVPIAHWFAPQGALHDFVRERLLGAHSELHSLFQPAVMEDLIAQNRTGPLWVLLFLEEWLRARRGKVM